MEPSFSYWIFTFSEYTDFSLGSADELFYRLKKNGRWHIGKGTQNRKKIKKGDKVILYQAGEGGRSFVGDAVLASDLQPPSEEELFGFVLISQLHIWKKSLPLSKIRKKLAFQKKKNEWQGYFQMAIRSIPEQDYLNLLKEAEHP
jgi:hypothetical protein